MDLELEQSDLLQEDFIEIPEEFLQENTEEKSEEINVENIQKEIEETETETENINDKVYSLFAKGLKTNKGIFAALEDEKLENIKSEDDLYDALVEDLESAKTEWIEHLNNNSKGLLKHLENGGKIEDFINVYAEDDYSNVSEEDVRKDDNIQEKIITELYKEYGWSNEKIKKKLDRIIDKEEEALDALDELKGIKQNKRKKLEEETIKANEARKVQHQEMWKGIENNTYNTKEFIPNKIVDKKTKDTVFKSINEIWSNVVNNPGKYAHILAYLNHYKLLDGDFSKVEVDALTKSNKKLAQTIESSKDKDEELRKALIYSIKNNSNKHKK